MSREDDREERKTRAGKHYCLPVIKYEEHNLTKKQDSSTSLARERRSLFLNIFAVFAGVALTVGSLLLSSAEVLGMFPNAVYTWLFFVGIVLSAVFTIASIQRFRRIRVLGGMDRTQRSRRWDGSMLF